MQLIRVLFNPNRTADNTLINGVSVESTCTVSLHSWHMEMCLAQLPVWSTHWICDFKTLEQSDPLLCCHLSKLLVASLCEEQLLSCAAIRQEGQGRATGWALVQYLCMQETVHREH